MDTINVTLNGSEVTGRPGMTVLELAEENGIYIPTLCHHPLLTPIGACRVCLVEDEKAGTLIASCVTPITPGMVINTQSAKVLEGWRITVELLLAGHPDACMICDKGNLCELRKIAAELEVGLPRFRLRKHYYPIEDVSPYIVRDLSKCILCQRCIRSCSEIAKHDVFSLAYRGFDCKVVVDLDQPIDKDVCRDCDVCISFCPTGALSKPSKIGGENKGKPQVITN